VGNFVFLDGACHNGMAYLSLGHTPYLACFSKSNSIQAHTASTELNTLKITQIWIIMRLAPSSPVALGARHLDMPLDHIGKPANGGSDPLANYNDGRKAVQGAGSPLKKRFPSYPGLDRFELLDLLGTGAFSNVYRASDRENKNAKVAVKVLRKFEMNEQQV
jgi:hypothetical protein